MSGASATRLRGLILAALALGACRRGGGPDAGVEPIPETVEPGADATAKDVPPARPPRAPVSGGPSTDVDAACDAAAFAPGVGLKPAAAVSGWQLRREVDDRFQDEAQREVVRTEGEPCAATDEACAKRLEDAWPEGSLRHDAFQTASYRYHLAAVQGGEVRLVSSEAELRSFLGEIDSPGDAATLLWAQGYDPICPAPAQVEGGFDVHARRTISECPMTRHFLQLRVGGDGAVEELEKREEVSNVCVGRLPEGAAIERCDPGTDAVGAWLAEVASLEALAVHAFSQLAAELRHHGAPAHLIGACEVAQADEARHAEAMGALAKAAGVTPAVASAPQQATRSLLQIACHNAEEGLVRETWGALVGAHQARYAASPGLAEAMAVIADEECQHAELSWDLHRWIWPQLDAEEQREVREAYRNAQAALRPSAREASAHDAQLGLPAGEAAVAMWQQLFNGVALA